MNKINGLDSLISGRKKYVTNVLPENMSNKTDIKKITRNSDNYYLQFNFSDNPQKIHQGFKIHISATVDNYQEILNEVFAFCKDKKVDFKYISNKDNLINNLSGQGNIWESGKFITVYPAQNKFKETIRKMYSLNIFQKTSGIYILTDRRYKNSNNIFYRYGVIYNTHNDKGIYDEKGNFLYMDHKQLHYSLPDFVEDPFPSKDHFEKQNHSRYLYKKYFPKKSIFSKSSGSVFVVSDRQNNFFIMKNARPGYSDGTISQIERLKKEEENLKKLKCYDFFPKIVDSFYEKDNYFLIETQIHGQNIDQFRANDLDKYVINNEYTEKTLNILKIIKNLCKQLSILHNNDIFLGDISAGNIIINTNNCSVTFVDVEQTIFNASTAKIESYMRTPGFFDEKTSFLSPFQQDIQQLGYLIISLFCRGNDFLQIDKSGQTTIKFFKKYAQLYKIPEEFVSLVLKCINSPEEKILQLATKIELGIPQNKHIQRKYEFPQDLLSQLIKTTTALNIDGFTEPSDKIEFKNEYEVLFTDSIKN